MEANPNSPATTPAILEGTEAITLGAGCFWCIEAAYNQIEGVKSAVSGYMGGNTPNPTYQDICTGQTGHAEVVRVVFEPEIISLERVLAWFWDLHDPTTLNRQGNDAGTQYRSAVFLENEGQRAVVEASMAAAQSNCSDPIVTEIIPAAEFHPAEKYHQQYYFQNPGAGYCQFVVAPKLQKLGLKY